MSVSIPISVDVRLVPESTAKPRTIRGYLLALLERTVVRLHPGLIDLRSDPALASHCISARVSLPARCDEAEGVPLWKANVQVFVYRAYDDVSVESFSADGDDGGDGEGDTVASHQYALPSTHFEGLWESLFFSSQIQDDLMRFAASSLRFAQRGVDPTVIAANRVILLHGPPGTGKTTLCKALAQRLSIRLNSTFPLPAQLIEVNAHSLFSKWFSESGKLVQRLFERVEEAASEEGSLVFVLIDEVESLAGSRGGSSGGSGSGSEPSDALRSVNALLTQLDRLQRLKNVLVLTTSNLTGAIDAAFLDRADVRRYIGPPGVKARYEVLRSCLRELARTGVLTAAGGTSAGGSGPVDDGEGGVSAVLLPFDAAVRAAPAKLRAALAGFDGVTTEAPPVPVPTPAPAPESRTGARAGQSMCEIGPTTVSSTPEFGPSPPIDSASPLCRDSSTASAHQDSSSSNRAGVDYVYKALAARAHSHHTPQAAAVFQKLSAAFAAHPELLPPETAQEAAAAEATAAVTAAAAAAAAAPGSAAAADATGSADRGGNDATAATAGILPAASGWLLHAAVVTCGLSGRSLRKLPLQAHAFGLPDEFYDDPDMAGHPAPLWAFAAALETAARQRLEG